MRCSIFVVVIKRCVSGLPRQETAWLKQVVAATTRLTSSRSSSRVEGVSIVTQHIHCYGICKLVGVQRLKGAQLLVRSCSRAVCSLAPQSERRKPASIVPQLNEQECLVTCSIQNETTASTIDVVTGLEAAQNGPASGLPALCCLNRKPRRGGPP